MVAFYKMQLQDSSVAVFLVFAMAFYQVGPIAAFEKCGYRSNLFIFFFIFYKEVLQLRLENAAIGILRLGLDCDEKEKNARLHLKLGLTALFTYLKIILLQYFQFSVLRNKRYPNRPLKSRFTKMRLQCCLQLHVSIAAIG